MAQQPRIIVKDMFRIGIENCTTVDDLKCAADHWYKRERNTIVHGTRVEPQARAIFACHLPTRDWTELLD